MYVHTLHPYIHMRTHTHIYYFFIYNLRINYALFMYVTIPMHPRFICTSSDKHRL